jgi:hypothetical protein
MFAQQVDIFADDLSAKISTPLLIPLIITHKLRQRKGCDRIGKD